MAILNIKEIIDLIVSGVKEPDEKIQKVFEWHFEKTLLVGKILTALGAALFVALIASQVKGELKFCLWQSLLINTSPLVPFLIGLVMLIRAKRIYRYFVIAQKLLGELTMIKAFLVLYREKR